MPDSGTVAAAAVPRDEMVDGQGGVRPHWRPLLAAFHAYGEGGMQERARRLDLALDEDGVGGVLPGTTAEARPWRCDPIPLLLQAGEFDRLEAGLAQRARLLSAVLTDLYGAQTLLSRGRVPATAIYASPGFLRPCHEPDIAASPRFTVYAADLVREADGEWRVLADRTSTSEGLGAARENRRLLARVLPEAFRPMQVRHQRGFFDRWRDAAVAGLPGTPAVALLTPGIAHPHWFEHVVLSRELSCILVEAGDLTVRGGRLFLKTLRGLQPINVLLRQTEGACLDPLELDTGGGISGILDAARDGGVIILNGPGTGVAETPVLAAALPDLAGELLGEELKLAVVPCRWLGEPAALREVERAPADWILRPAADEGAPITDIGAAADADQVLARVRARPWEWVAIAAGHVGTVPCVGPSSLEPQPLVLRLFLVWDGAEWRALRGGLARIADRVTGLGGLARGMLTKDVWVLAEERADLVGPHPVPVAALKLRRTTGDMPSRVADNLFWLGRYVERVERAARLIRAAASRLIQAETLSPRQAAGLRVLSICLTEARLVPSEALGTPGTLREALLAALRPRGAMASMFSEISRLTESVRDRLTDEMYAAFVQSLAAARTETENARTLDRLTAAMAVVQRFCTAVSGVAAENMVRGGGFLFLDLGRRIERARAVAAEVATALDQPPSHVEGGLALILELCDSAITYRSRYLNVVQPAPVLDLVLVDQGNPRGLAFQLVAMHDHLDDLTQGGFGREVLAGAAAGLLAGTEALVSDLLAAPDQARAASGLVASLRGLSGELADLSDRIVRRYFSLLPTVRPVGWGSERAGT